VQRAWWRRAPRKTAAGAQARSTISGVLLLQVLANGAGAAVVALYLRFLFPGPPDAQRTELNLLVFALYLGSFMLVGIPVNALVLRRAVSWVRDARPPTARERWFVFWLPAFETIASLVSWIGAAVVFGLLNTTQQRVSLAIGLSGLVTCTLLYMLLEAHFRPVYALALVDADLPEGRRDVFPRLMLAWLLGSGLPLAGLGLSPLAGATTLDRTRLPWLGLAGVLGGGAVMCAAAFSISRPIGRVRQALRQVELGDLETAVPVDDLGELGQLAEGVNHLVTGLREREQLRELFGKQVGQTELAEVAGDGPGEGSDRREVTVLFVDLQGYTRYSERHSPEEVVAMLNRFFRAVVAVVNREGGWVNKFEGDAALCIFGAPATQADHAVRALRAAAALPRELARATDVLPAGVGVASGEVLAGFVGTAERYEYTVIGDVVNLAARLCELAKDQRSGVLADAVTVDEAGSPEPWVTVGRIRVRGRRERTTVATIATRGGARRGSRGAARAS
jgi:adenylate cyclase